MFFLEICLIAENKRQFLPLLLLGDEQESMIDRYLDRSALWALYDGGQVRGVCAVTDEGGGRFEIQNLAVEPASQRRGYGQALVKHAVSACQRQGGTALLAGTGDSPRTLPFYAACGFRQRRRVKNYFPKHYDHPIYEGGQLVTDRVELERPLR